MLPRDHALADLALQPLGELDEHRHVLVPGDLAADPDSVGDLFARTPTSIRVVLLEPRVVPVNARADDGAAWDRLRADPTLAGFFDALPIAALAPVLVR